MNSIEPNSYFWKLVLGNRDDFLAMTGCHCVRKVCEGKYRLTTPWIARDYLHYLAGNKGETLQAIQRNHDVRVIFPDQNSTTDEFIAVESQSKEDLWDAFVTLAMMVCSEHPNVTHMMSVPCTNKEIISNFLRFRNELSKKLKDCFDYGPKYIDNFFCPPETLHISLTDLVIDWGDGWDFAKDAIRRCKKVAIDPILKGRQLKVRIAGIDCVENRSRGTRMLFAKVESKQLQEIANEMSNLFMREYPLVNRWTENVKLFMPLTDTNCPCNLTEKDREHKESCSPANVFAAPRETLSQFKDFDFGALADVREIHLSELSTRDNKTGYFTSKTKILM